MVGNEGADPKRGGQLRSSRSIAMVDDEEAEGEDGADVDEWARANDAKEVGNGCRGEGSGDVVGSVISRSLGVDGRRMCRAILVGVSRHKSSCI